MAFVLLLCANLAFAGDHHLVPWISESHDHSEEIRTAISRAMQDNGVIEFAAGKVYGVTKIMITSSVRTKLAAKHMPAGIDGNGATIKALEGAHHSLLYIWSPQDASNKDFFLRDLTIDCAGHCDYGLRVWGGNDFIVENVTSRRAKEAGVYLQGSKTATGEWELYNATLRNVMSANNEGHGFHIWGNWGTDGVRDLSLENCYAHRNGKSGFFIERAQVDILGMGAENNAGPGLTAGSDEALVDSLRIYGGYTENNYLDSGQDTAIKLQRGKVSNVSILGGRFIGQFSYNEASLGNSVIHSYGHKKIGFQNNGATPLHSVHYKPTQTSIYATVSDNSAYTGIPLYFFDGTSAKKLLKERNIHLVSRLPYPANWNYAPRIQAAIEEAMKTGGLVAFEPYRFYPTTAISIDKADSGTGSMPAGILGNSAFLYGIGKEDKALLRLHGIHRSSRPQDGDTWFDHHNAFVRNLHLYPGHNYASGLELSASKFFQIQNVNIYGGKDSGVKVSGYAQNGTYYGVFESVRTRWSGNGFSFSGFADLSRPEKATGIYLANVGVFNSSVDYGYTHGLSFTNASVTLSNMTSTNNDGAGAYAKHTRSLDFINPVFKGNSRAFKLAGVDSTEWTAGVHVIGGTVTGEIDYLATSTNGYDLKHSMIQTSEQPEIANAYWMRGRNFGLTEEGSD
jgi:hypothetical protein